jgi:antirestriction protein ArdC
MAKKKFDPREMVGEHIIKLVEAGGTLPWMRPWDVHSLGMPRNAMTGAEYRGGNWMLFSMLPYQHPLYLTYKQLTSAGGKLKEAEKKAHWPVVMYKPFSVEDDSGNKKTIPLFRYYNVWNVDQVEASPDVDGGKTWEKFYTKVTRPASPSELAAKPKIEPIQAAELVHMNYKNGPAIHHFGGRACYSPGKDEIRLPDINDFHSAEEYHLTRFHEETHSTGHKARLNRKGLTENGMNEYDAEELVAEIGACMLAGYCGILDAQCVNRSLAENSAAYIASWLKNLKQDPKMLYKAASEASRATDHILGIVRTYEKKPEADAADDETEHAAA